MTVAASGSFAPYRVMVQGEPGNLQYLVIDPQGKRDSSWGSAREACDMARLLHSIH